MVVVVGRDVRASPILCRCSARCRVVLIVCERLFNSHLIARLVRLLFSRAAQPLPRHSPQASDEHIKTGTSVSKAHAKIQREATIRVVNKLQNILG